MILIVVIDQFDNSERWGQFYDFDLFLKHFCNFDRFEHLEFLTFFIIFVLFLQIAELCAVEPILASTPQVSTSEDNEDKLDNGVVTTTNTETSSTPNKTENSLICLDESKLDFGLTMDNFTLEDIQDDDFDPRALDSSPAPVTPIAHVTPVLAPPPALPPRDAPKTAENNNNPFMDSSDPFGSASKSIDDPFGMATFTPPNAIKPINSNPLASLDDLDPFKNL